MSKKLLVCAALFSHVMTSVLPLMASGFGRGAAPSAEEMERTGPSALSSNTPSRSTVSPPEEFSGATAALWQQVQDPNPQRQWDYMKQLWYLPGEQQTQTQKDLLPIFLRVAQDNTHPHQWAAIEQLWDLGADYAHQSRALIYPTLLSIVQNPQNLYHLEANKAFWFAAGPQGAQYRRTVAPHFLQIAQSPGPDQWYACALLWEDPQNHEALRPTLWDFTRGQKNPESWEALSKLWNLRNPLQAQDRPELRPLLLSVAHDSTHAHRWDALFFLWFSNDSEQERNRADVRDDLMAFAQMDGNFHQKDALHYLGTSNNPADQAWVRTLQQQVDQ